jgi:alkylhydroperoxidase family enzyme
MDAIAAGKLDSPAIPEKERALLKYVNILTLRPAQVTDEDVALVRKAGWTDEEIWEASFITSLFAFFNRMADAYGLDYPSGGYLPPEERPKTPEKEPAAGK